MIDWINIFILLFLFSISAVIIIMFLKIKKFFRPFLRVVLLRIFCFKGFSGFLVSLFALLLVDLFVSVDRFIVHWSWILSLGGSQIVCGMYPNWTYGFDSPKAFGRLWRGFPVGCSDLFASIYCFAWSKISLKFLFKPSFVDFWLVFI